MDGDHVSGEPSDGPVSFAETFANLCPQYMALGMTYAEFWGSNTVVHKAYREAAKIKQHSDEWSRWRQGAYIYDALLRVAPVMRASFGGGRVEPGKYPEEPWPLTEKEAREREEAMRIKRMEQFMAKLTAESKQETKKREAMSVVGEDR